MNISLQALSDLAAFFFLASLKASLLVALVLLVRRVAGGYLSAGARYLLWLSVVIGLVTPVGFDTALPAILLPDITVAAPTAMNSGESNDLPVSRATRDFAGATPPPFSLPAQSVQAEPTVMTDPPFPGVQVLPYLWLAGVLLVLCAIAASSYRFARLVRRATGAPAAVQELLQDCMRQTRCSPRVPVLQSADIQVPMIAGLFRPVLLLPQDMEWQVTREQLRHVFIHELMHLQRGDILANWVVALVQALHWFNPVIWFAFFCMRQDRELACDAATLRHLAPSDRAAYGHTLLQLNDALPEAKVPAFALGILGSSSHLQARILMLVQSHRYRKLQSFVATLLFLPLAAVAFSQPAPRAVEPQAAAEPIAPLAAVASAAAEPAVPTVATVPASPNPAPAATVIPAEPVTPTAAPVPTTPAAPAPAAPVEPARPALQDARNLEPAVPNAALLAQLAATPVTDPFAVEPGVVDSAANAQEAPVETDADLVAAIQLLADEIGTAKPAGIRFIEELETAATECAARGDGILATLSGPCTRTRRALRRGQIFYFGYECFLLGARQEELANQYEDLRSQAPGSTELGVTLRENAENLATFCSKDTYAQQYPAFASLFAESESLEHFHPSERTISYVHSDTILYSDRGTIGYYQIGLGTGGGMEASSGAYGGPASQAAPAAEAPAPAPAPQ